MPNGSVGLLVTVLEPAPHGEDWVVRVLDRWGTGLDRWPYCNEKASSNNDKWTYKLNFVEENKRLEQMKPNATSLVQLLIFESLKVEISVKKIYSDNYVGINSDRVLS